MGMQADGVVPLDPQHPPTTAPGLSLAVAIGGSFWLASTLRGPRSRGEARRMREGVYTEEIGVSSSDELGELAGSFNAMEHAIAERAAHDHQAHHDGLSGLPNRR